MDTKDVKEVLKRLDKCYPDAKPELVFGNPYELTVAVILSAQCTDRRVNTVTPEIFKRYPDATALADADVCLLERLIYSCGFYHNKAVNLIGMAKAVRDKFGGEIPDNLDDLRSLPGVGRKTANVVYSVAFNGNAIAVDTHVFRVSNRIGIADAENVLDTERQLMRAIPEAQWGRAHHLLIFHGRRVCASRKPNCNDCVINDLCKYKGDKNV